MKNEGLCEVPECGEIGIIFLNGEQLLCWPHYKQFHEARKDLDQVPVRADIQALFEEGQRLQKTYIQTMISIVAYKQRRKELDKGVDDDVK